MKPNRIVNLLPIILTLIVTSACFFALQGYIYHDQRNTGFYLLQDLAFLPIQVLLVTLVLNEMFMRQDRAKRLNKMNMVIGVFIFDIGIPLLKNLSTFERNVGELIPHLQLTAHWREKELTKALDQAWKHEFDIDCRAGDLTSLKTYLLTKRDGLLRLMENSNLLEHETFTDLLWAINHLTDELQYRENIVDLSEPDANHLPDDMKRAFTLLITSWLSYMNHIRKDYPYLFSLVVRTNPFDPTAKVEIQK